MSQHQQQNNIRADKNNDSNDNNNYNDDDEDNNDDNDDKFCLLPVNATQNTPVKIKSKHVPDKYQKLLILRWFLYFKTLNMSYFNYPHLYIVELGKIEQKISAD